MYYHLMRHGQRVSKQKQRITSWVLFIALLLNLLPQWSQPVQAASMTVTTLDYNTTTNGQCSLLEAINNALNIAQTYPDCPAGSGSNTITMGVAGTISINATMNINFVVVGRSLAIQGHAQGTTLQRAAGFTGAVFTIVGEAANNFPSTEMTLSGLDIGGSVSFQGGNLTLTSSKIHNADGLGIGLLVQYTTSALLSTVTIQNSAITDNARSGILIRQPDATIRPKVVINRSLIANNSGQGIDAANTALHVFNTTISGNRMDGLSGRTRANMELKNVTIANNGGYGLVDTAGTTVQMANSIIVQGSGAAACSVSGITSEGNNLSSDASCELTASSDIANGTAALGALQDNGGPTWTHALLPNSQAIDAGNFSVCNNANVGNVDQRGIARPQGTQCDIGAFEAQYALQGEWRLDETSWNGTASEVRDSSGNSRTGTAQNSATTANTSPTKSGDPGTCRYGVFDGNDKAVSIPYSAALNPAGSFTLAFWANLTGGSGNRAAVTSRDTIVASQTITQARVGFNVFAGSNGQWEFWTGTETSSWHQTVAPNAIILNQWSHVAARFEAKSSANGIYTGTKTIFIDGAQVAQSTNATYRPNTTNPLYIGISNNNQFDFIGNLDEVRLYSGALADTTIAGLKNATHPCSGVEPTATSTPTPIPPTATPTPTLTPTLTPTPTPTPVPVSAFRFQAAHSGKCMAVQDASQAENALIVQATCGSTNAQDWTGGFGGGDRIKALHSNKCLASPSSTNGAQLVQRTCTNDSSQSWRVYTPPDSLNSYGHAYRNDYSGLCIDVSGSSTADGAAILQFDCSAVAIPESPTTLLQSRKNQQWTRVTSPNPVATPTNVPPTAIPTTVPPTATPTTVPPTATPTAVPPTATPTAQLQTEWRFETAQWNESNGQIADSSGNGRTATGQNSPTTANGSAAVTGNTGTCGYGAFNGTNQWLNVPYNAALNPDGSFTVSFWAKVTGGNNTWRSPITSRWESADGAQRRGYLVYAGDDNNWQFWLGTGSNRWQIITGSAVQLNTWTHIAARFESQSVSNGIHTGTQTLFINGAQAAQATNVNYQPNIINPLTIAAGGGTGTQFYFPGNLDEMRVYSGIVSNLNTLTTAGHLCTGANVAQGKTASQSSTAHNGAAGRAVDGNIDGNFFATPPSVTHTNSEANAWWQVDLGTVHDLTSIKLWNRTDCCANRLSNFYVFVANSDMNGRSYSDLLNDTTVWKYQNAGTAGTLTLIPAATQGRYVRVQLAGTEALSLAEVQIFGLPNVAQGKTASQSSNPYGTIAGRAVDGNIDGNFFATPPSVTHTNNEANAWWQVDLGSTHTLSTITLWNRTDCCANRLSNFYVFVSNENPSTSSFSSLVNNPQVWQYQYAGTAGRQLVIPANQAQGRYIRVQLAGTEALSLAEVQAFGEVVNNGVASAAVNEGEAVAQPVEAPAPVVETPVVVDESRLTQKLFLPLASNNAVTAVTNSAENTLAAPVELTATPLVTTTLLLTGAQP